MVRSGPLVKVAGVAPTSTGSAPNEKTRASASSKSVSSVMAKVVCQVVAGAMMFWKIDRRLKLFSEKPPEKSPPPMLAE